MTLDDYLAADGNTAAALAEKAGTSGASITRILYGEQQPSFDMIRAIVKATDGKVTAHDIVFGRSRSKPNRPTQDAA